MARSDLEQLQDAPVSLGSDGHQGMGQQLEQQLLAVALEERAGLLKLPPGESRNLQWAIETLKQAIAGLATVRDL